MDKEFILEFNKKCASFLGLKYGWWIHQEKPLTDDKKQWWDIDGKTILGTRVYYNKDLMFHEDWNWIMEVVEAIEKLKFNVRITKSSITIETSVGCEFDLKTIYSFHSDEYPITKKEAVIHAINNFLDSM